MGVLALGVKKGRTELSSKVALSIKKGALEPCLILREEGVLSDVHSIIAYYS